MKVLPALLAALCWTSCSDFLEDDPKGQLPSDTYFSNKEDLDASLTALYSVIASSQASNNLCGTNFLVGDDISTHPSSNKQPLRRTLRIINDKISGLDNFETLFPHTGQPRVIVFHIKLIMLTERPLILSLIMRSVRRRCRKRILRWLLHRRIIGEPTLIFIW